MADGVARSPSQLRSKDGNLRWRRLEYDFLACLLSCLVSYFLFFVFLFLFFSLHPGMFSFFVSLRLCSTHLLLSASTYFIVRVLSLCCVICTLPHLGMLLYSFSIFFRSSYFSGGVFSVVLSYPVG